MVDLKFSIYGEAIGVSAVEQQRNGPHGRDLGFPRFAAHGARRRGDLFLREVLHVGSDVVVDAKGFVHTVYSWNDVGSLAHHTPSEDNSTYPDVQVGVAVSFVLSFVKC